MSLYNHINQGGYGYLREFCTYSLYPFINNNPKSRFLIFGRGRSGSTLLVSLLNSSPDIYCDKEILNRKVLSPEKFIRIRSKIFHKKIYGFKLLSYQLRSIQNIKNPADFLNHLIDSEFRIIFLHRTNIIRQTLSRLYASYRSTWHERKIAKNQEIKKMTVDSKYLLECLDESKNLEVFELNLMNKIPHLKVIYEQDLLFAENHQNLINKITEYMNIPPFKPSTDLKKITTKDLSGFLNNSNEIVDFLLKTEYSKYL